MVAPNLFGDTEPVVIQINFDEVCRGIKCVVNSADNPTDPAPMMNHRATESVASRSTGFGRSANGFQPDPW